VSGAAESVQCAELIVGDASSMRTLISLFDIDPSRPRRGPPSRVVAIASQNGFSRRL
jgi:hypothetical protein